ncbi:MAG: hypothetical protein EHM45_23630 [Desulfobacteraceae bacterium]|nr:MAG: hypothetical protein EHM45_23630 [Desulfobacteraceae bacterium]
MPKKKRARESETLIGIVTPVQWDQEDRVTAVALCATDDEQYLIENSDQFINLIQKSIQATGVVKREPKTTKSIAIRQFCILESF